MRFLVDGKAIGSPVPLDANGQAQWIGASQSIGNRPVSAEYLPALDSPLKTGRSGATHYAPARIRQQEDMPIRPKPSPSK